MTLDSISDIRFEEFIVLQHYIFFIIIMIRHQHRHNVKDSYHYQQKYDKQSQKHYKKFRKNRNYDAPRTIQLLTKEKMTVPKRHKAEIPHKTICQAAIGGSIPPHQPMKKNMGHASRRVISQPLAVNTISPRFDFTKAII